MAKPKKSTSRSTPKPKPVPRTAPAFRPTYDHPRTTKAPTPNQAAQAAQQGLLQLTFGRHAHGYGIVAAVAFLVDALLLVAMGTSPTFPTLPGGYPEFTLCLIPAAAGAFASVDAVRLKREPYRRQYLSRHFVTSALGMVLFFVVAAFILLVNWRIAPLAILPWLYPLSVLGVPLTIISMAMTWEGVGARKAGSIALALILPIAVFLLVLGNVPIAPASGGTVSFATFSPIVILFAGALTTEFSGALLHIIASSTSVYQREILKADNTKVALLQQELQKKREALDYKERAIRGREAHMEALQQELDEQAGDLKTKVSDITQREVALDKGSKELRDLDRKVASARAEIEAKVEELRLRESDVAAAK